MQDDFGADLLTLVDDEGKEHEFEVLDVIDNDDGCFYALQPSCSTPQEMVDTEGTYYIFEAVEENGEQVLSEVENDELLDRLAGEFEKRFEEMYGDENEDSEAGTDEKTK
jgi:uncharacterized protein YrzB (UPF0473 family)